MSSTTPNTNERKRTPPAGRLAALRVLRGEPVLQRFLIAHTQSSLGNGIGYVAILLIAAERLNSPWAVTLVLLADFVPSMLLGPLFGAAADRWPRRRCALAANLLRAAAFLGLGLVDSFVATVAFALLAGTGTGLFTPAVMAGLPSMVRAERLPAATSLTGAIDELGYVLGPVLAAPALLLVAPGTVLAGNGVLFLLAAALLRGLPMGGGARAEAGPRTTSLAGEVGEGVRVLRGCAGIPTLLAVSGATILFFGGINVAELLFVRDVLDAGASGFSLVVGAFGAGSLIGTLASARSGELADLKRRFLIGLVLAGAAFLAFGAATTLPVAVAAGVVAGFGNGMAVVNERLLVQRAVPDAIMGRVFGLRAALIAWAFATSYVCAGALVTLLGPRAVLILTGLGVLAVWAGATIALRSLWRNERPSLLRRVALALGFARP